MRKRKNAVEDSRSGDVVVFFLIGRRRMNRDGKRRSHVVVVRRAVSMSV